MSDEQNQQNRLLRSFILQQVLNQRCIINAYRNFCEEHGENAMEYPEFDFWYYRFYNQEHLDYDRSLTPKKRTLSDLPVEMVKKLVDRLGPVDRLALRKVSHFHQDVVHEKTIAVQELSFAARDHYANMYLDSNGLINYKPMEEGCQVLYNRSKDMISDGNYLKMAINDFLYVMKQPKLQLKRLVIKFDVSSETEKGKKLTKMYLNFIESELKTLNHQIHVENVIFTSEDLESFLSIFPYLKPRTLQSITLNSISSESNQSVLDKFFELDQWKQAVRIEGYLNPTDNFPMSIEKVFYFTHFPYIGRNMTSISREDLIKLRDVLLKTSNFEHYRYELSFERISKQDVENIFNVVIEHYPSQFRYRVPDTDKVIQFSFKPYSLIITTQLFDQQY